jgi:hypothetical protein
MALSSESNKQVFSPTAGQTSFQFTLKYFNSTDIKVEIKLANGNIVPASDFSFTVSAINNNEELGANVVITISPALAVGDVVTIFREVLYTQQYDLQPGSPINPTALNDAFDRVVAQNQQQNLNTQRTITFPVSDPSTTTYNVDSSTTQRANRALGFDSNGNITELNLSSTNTVAGNNNKGIDLVDSVIEAKVDSVTTTFDVNGNIIVKDSGITAAKLNTNSVTTAKILNDNVTYDKLQDISTSNSVLGNTGTGTVAERALVGDILLDEDTMTSNSAIKGATQQSIKSYVDSKQQYFHLQETAAGTSTGITITADAYTTRQIVSVSNNITGASIDGSYIITLPAGTYKINGYATVRGDGTGTTPHQTSFRNTSDNTTAVIGASVCSLGATNVDNQSPVPSVIEGVFTITSSKTFIFRTFKDSSGNTTAGFPTTATDEDSVYADLLIQKIG